MRIARRLFLVPLADNNHGKSTIIRAAVSQGLGRTFQIQRKGHRQLTSPRGRLIDSYVFGRSYQEVERHDHGSVVAALDANDPNWRERELIIMPSHLNNIGGNDDDEEACDDIDEMIEAGQRAGFDVVCATVLFTDGTEKEDRKDFEDVWYKEWDERWTIPNPYLTSDPEGQLEALGRDLWFWICATLAA